MIKKQLVIPTRILTYEALLRRLIKNHQKRQEIHEELAKGYAGYKGELSLDYYFNLLPTNDYYFLHNLRLPNTNGLTFFQIDILMLTPFFLLIIEVKNISGTLTFDPTFDQLIWTTPEKEIALPDPVRQANNQRYQLKELLKSKKLPPLPIETIVTLTNSKTIIKILTDNEDYIQRIIRSPKLISKIESFKKRYTKEWISTKEMSKIANILIKHHTPATPDLLEQYSLEKRDIIKGVYCDKCSSLKMKYHWGEWICENCSFKNKEGHIHALQDFGLLFQKTITNHQCKEFLHLPNSDSAYYLLRTMDLKHTGAFKNRKYYLPIILD